MVKRFRIPSPHQSPGASDGRIIFDLNEGSPDDVEESLKKAGLSTIYHEVCGDWLRYAIGKIARFGRTRTFEEGTASSQRTVENGEALCRAMAIIYVGRRVGNLSFRVRHASHDKGEQQSADHTLAALSASVNELAADIGEHQAAAVFRRLEKATDKALRSKFGRTTKG
jgi:hypothetical protein